MSRCQIQTIPPDLTVFIATAYFIILRLPEFNIFCCAKYCAYAEHRATPSSLQLVDTTSELDQEQPV